jgi:hypothetical protein
MKVQKMAEKGSKYARKKARIAENKAAKQREEMAGGEKFLDVIYNDVDFINVFQSLSLPDQVKAYRTLKRLMEGLNKADLSESDKALGEMAEYKLEKINAIAGLKLEEKRHYALSSEELHLIRMDCYGAVDERPSHQLSDFYKGILRRPLSKKQTLKNYNLDNAPAWKIFRQFSSFRKIEPDICRYMAKMRINPDIITVMGVKDFSDLIFKTFRTDKNQIKVAFSKEDPPRNAFVKAMANKYGSRIAEILRSENIDERYINSLLSAMKNYGSSDTSRIIITETYFTPRVLTDLAKAKIPCDEYQIGDKIPQTLINALMHEDKGILLAARDENGSRLQAENFPSFEVHHKTAVMESGRLAYIAMVNYRNNFVLTSSDLHRHVLHGFDILSSSGRKEAYHRRLEFTNPNITFMFGFTPDKQIECNWNHGRAYTYKAETDVANIVSYDAVMAELTENRKAYLSNSTVDAFDLDDVVKSIKRKHHKEMKLKKHTMSKNELKKAKFDNVIGKIITRSKKSR